MNAVARVAPGRGRFWALVPVAMLGLLVAVQVALLHTALTEGAPAIEERYYEKAVHYDAVLAQEKRNAELGWRLTAAIEPATSGRAIGRVAITDASGEPVARAKVTVEAFHVAHGRTLAPAASEAEPGTYRFEFPLGSEGLWEFRFEVARGSEVFTARIRADVERRKPVP